MRTGIWAAAALVALAPCRGASPDWALGPFARPAGVNPVIVPKRDSVFECPVRRSPVHWEALHTFNPAAVVRNGRIYVLYRAEDDSGSKQLGSHTSRLGLAESTDGMHFERRPAPVFGPAEDDQKSREWPGGCEDPRLVETEDGGYVLTYTQWNGTIWRAASATSRDLVHWTKHGPLFGTAAGGKYSNLAYKSAGIVTRVAGNRLVAAKIRGRYWMYWGEGHIHLASSADLAAWQPLEDSHGALVDVLGPRTGHFDSDFPEVGPPAILTSKGIVLVYNGKNAANGDRALAAGAYAAGQALFAADHPERLLDRLEQPFFQPSEPFERSGQYAAGTTFTEGLVLFHDRWFLYYGCADSFVGAAVAAGAGLRE